MNKNDEFEQGFQYALYVLNTLGVDVESILGSETYKNIEQTEKK
jgi:hypothetical protein